MHPGRADRRACGQRAGVRGDGNGDWHANHLRLALPHGEDPAAHAHEPAALPGAVLRTERATPSMHRVTVTGDDLHEFGYLGFDHWFRLFMPAPAPGRVPAARSSTARSGGRRSWPSPRTPPALRELHRRRFRPGTETAANWTSTSSCTPTSTAARGPRGALGRAAQPGDELAFLDQGCIFDCPDDAPRCSSPPRRPDCPASSASGVAAAGRRRTDHHEVPTAADMRELAAPEGCPR